MKRILLAFALAMPLVLQACGQGGSENSNPPPTQSNGMQQQSSPQNAPAAPQTGAPEQEQSPSGSNGTSQ
ncbi:MAG: hypothetical protein P8124_11075 [Gammaproteobacteria bacterium]